jgi:hypothetical protein
VVLCLVVPGGGACDNHQGSTWEHYPYAKVLLIEPLLQAAVLDGYTFAGYRTDIIDKNKDAEAG